MLSNDMGVFPLQQPQHYSVSMKSKIKIDQPLVISHYNRNMGGVDLWITTFLITEWESGEKVVYDYNNVAIRCVNE
jgi:hypothetical protein